MWGSALPSAAKSNRGHYQSKVFVGNQWACAGDCADAVDQLLICVTGGRVNFPGDRKSYTTPLPLAHAKTT